MIIHQNISPEIFSLGPLTLRWYGLLYVSGLLIAYLLSERRLLATGLLKKGDEGKPLNTILIGVVVGARLGYCLFYNFSYYAAHPLEVLYIWNGGLSFHGGLLGVMLALWFLGGQTSEGLYRWGDVFARYTPIGLGLGRLGNFMNSELVGRPTNGSWGMVFDRVDQLPRHPSQLYEACLEGLVLFLLLNWIGSRTQKTGVLFWTFIGFYGLFRFLLEFLREPDAQLGFVAGPLSLGQLLSLPMILIAFGAAFFRFKKTE